MTSINYNHSQNLHIIDGPSIIFPIVKDKYKPKSILDVGCGVGTWLKIVSDYGIEDFIGIDGIEVETKDFFSSKEKFQKHDLTSYWDIGRKFDLILCLEVAEHLPDDLASNFIQILTNHADAIIFSAACPNQPGQGHINCQWIEYWQDLFNKYGYACFDEIRPLIWNKSFPEWWYKQNIFIAKKDKVNAGKESRIHSMIHPDLYMETSKSLDRLNQIAIGNSNVRTYLDLFVKSIMRKLTPLKINK